MATISPTDLSGGASTPTAAVAPVSQPDTIEGTQAPAAPETAPKAPVLSPELAKLAQQERAIRAQARALQAEKAKILAEQESIKTQRAEYEKLKAWKDRTLKDPYGGLLDEGLTSDQVASLMLNQPAPVDQNIILLQRQVQEMRDAQAASKAQAEQLQVQQLESVRKQILQQVKVLVDGNDSYENIRADNAEQLVVDTIEEYYKEHGEVLSAEEASTHVEEILLEDALKKAQRKNIQARLLAAKAPATEEAPTTPAGNQTPTPTLTNRMTPSSATTAKKLTWEQRKERAILAAQGKLA